MTINRNSTWISSSSSTVSISSVIAVSSGAFSSIVAIAYTSQFGQSSSEHTFPLHPGHVSSLKVHGCPPQSRQFGQFGGQLLMA
jgi:hypothetical protein